MTKEASTHLQMEYAGNILIKKAPQIPHQKSSVYKSYVDILKSPGFRLIRRKWSSASVNPQILLQG